MGDPLFVIDNRKTMTTLIGVSGIYSITNTANGKVYVGHSCDVGLRLRGHLAELRHGRHANQHLQASFKKHGEKVFVVALLQRVSGVCVQAREIYWIKELKANTHGFNFTIGGEGIVGHTHTEESKAKMSAAKKGWVVSPETRAKLAAAHRGKKRIFSAEHRANLSKALLGHKVSKNSIEKLIARCKGKPLAPETRAKISAAGKGRYVSPEQRANMSAGTKAGWVKRRLKCKGHC